jgi:hypothetical protein
MPEYHKEDEIYFGEDYYDEDEALSDQDEIKDDPYAEAERLHRLATRNLGPTNYLEDG